MKRDKIKQRDQQYECFGNATIKKIWEKFESFPYLSWWVIFVYVLMCVIISINNTIDFLSQNVLKTFFPEVAVSM